MKDRNRIRWETRERMRRLNATPAGRYRRAQRVCRLQLARITAGIGERYALEQTLDPVARTGP
jgi:hypothetical protein